MWYFAWILGTGLAALAAVLNGMWFEAREPERDDRRSKIISTDACRFGIPYVTYAAPSGCSSVW